MHHTTGRITFVTPIVKQWLEREISQWVHHEGLIHRATSCSWKTTVANNENHYYWFTKSLLVNYENHWCWIIKSIFAELWKLLLLFHKITVALLWNCSFRITKKHHCWIAKTTVAELWKNAVLELQKPTVAILCKPLLLICETTVVYLQNHCYWLQNHCYWLQNHCYWLQNHCYWLQNHCCWFTKPLLLIYKTTVADLQNHCCWFTKPLLLITCC